MLLKTKRLQKDKDIKTVLRLGKIASSSKLVIKWLPNKISNPKLALVISKKIDKRATKRNQIRRVLREHLRQNYLLKPGQNIVIVVRPGTQNLDNKQLRKALDKVLAQSKIIN
jgi:ribonuclease P protein component